MVSRELVAAALGVGLGLLLVVYPDAMIRSFLAGRSPQGRHGEYGTEGLPDEKWRWLVRGLGAVVVLAGLAFGTIGFGVGPLA
jgi:hypothetical protein